MNKTALNLLYCNALGKFKRLTRASRCTVWEPWSNRTVDQNLHVVYFLDLPCLFLCKQLKWFSRFSHTNWSQWTTCLKSKVII